MESSKYAYYKNNETDTIEWADTGATEDGLWLFRFGTKGLVFNMFRDYPHELTAEQKRIFDEENPYWAEFFKDRTAE